MVMMMIIRLGDGGVMAGTCRGRSHGTDVNGDDGENDEIVRMIIMRMSPV